MPDLKDELDALFEDDGESKAEEAAEETAEEQAEEAAEDGEKAEAKPKSGLAKKSKLVGARTGAINVARKLPGKPAVAAKPAAKTPEPQPEPEPEEPAPAHVSHAKVAAAPASSGGGLLKLLLVLSLVLNVVVLALVAGLFGKLGTLQDQLVTTNNNIASATTMSRANVGVYTDRGGVDTAVLFYLPTDVNQFAREGKAVPIPLEKLLKNTSKE